MLNHIAPNAKSPDQVVVFSKIGCSHCAKAKQLLSDNGFEYIDVPLENKVRGKVLGAVSGSMTAPQVFINGNLIGGAEALEQYLSR
ncbi:Hybrid peroxiredoxin hyPrx5 [compost metagenome]